MRPTVWIGAPGAALCFRCGRKRPNPTQARSGKRCFSRELVTAFGAVTVALRSGIHVNRIADTMAMLTAEPAANIWRRTSVLEIRQSLQLSQVLDAPRFRLGAGQRS